MVIHWHYINKLNWLSSALDWLSEDSGLHNSLMITQMSLAILFQVHTHSLNMNNSVTQLRISYLGLQKHMSHFHMSHTISNYSFRLKEITTAYPANLVRLWKALVTKDSGRKRWDALSNNCNRSDNVRQSSKVVSKDAKHDNKG